MKDLLYVVGTAETSQPAVMRFYGAVTESTVEQFNSEFRWLHDVVKPSKIVIYINSEGGSVIRGMSSFSMVLESEIPVCTIIDGIAASMGSVLWAAGSERYMRDYSILMIHNPFLGCSCSSEEQQQQVISAFKHQLETIYMKRFGLTKSKVREIMDGDKGCDGTYMTAQDAMENGFLEKGHIIKTNDNLKKKVSAVIEGVENMSAAMADIDKIVAEVSDFTPTAEITTIFNKKSNNKNNNDKNMNEKLEILNSLCAQLGIGECSEISPIVAKITEMKGMVAKVTEMEGMVATLKKSVDELNIKKEGLEAQVANLTKENDSLGAKLQVYKDAEKKAKDAEVEALVEDAIKNGKIPGESKAKWIEMAQNSLELVKETLNSIAPVAKITEEIANDPKNVHDANAQTDAEKEMEAKLKEVVGENFAFRKFDE